MMFKDLTEEMRQEILNTIKDKLLKLGINTEVTIGAKTIYNGKEMIFVESKPFNTTPVIYKSIKVDGSGFINMLDNGDYALNIGLTYRFDYFNGGENGVDIGAIKFVIFPNTGRVANLGLVI